MTILNKNYVDLHAIIQIKTVLFWLSNISKYQFFLFGSRSDWTCKEKSDYDIWVIGQQKLDSETRLFLEEQFESIPVSIDLVDFSEVDDVFKEKAMKNIVWLNT